MNKLKNIVLHSHGRLGSVFSNAVPKKDLGMELPVFQYAKPKNLVLEQTLIGGIIGATAGGALGSYSVIYATSRHPYAQSTPLAQATKWQAAGIIAGMALIGAFTLGALFRHAAKRKKP